MCLMCVEILKERMTGSEAVRARSELIVPVDHEEELAKVIESALKAEALAKAKVIAAAKSESK